MAGYGWARDVANNRLDIEVAGTTVAQLTTTALTLPSDVSSGLTVTAGGLTVTAGGLTVTAGGIYVAAGRITETLTAVDDNSQNMTLAAADILAGINVHTSTGGGGTVTVDTAANIISGVPLANDDQCVVSYYVNDGDQTATFAVASGTTIADTGNTVLINEAAVLLWRRTSSSAVVLYMVSS
jgi:hypothetical protein